MQIASNPQVDGFKADLLNPAWANLIALLHVVEEFVFWLPVRSPHDRDYTRFHVSWRQPLFRWLCSPLTVAVREQNAGLHLSANGALDFPLVDAVVKLLAKLKSAPYCFAHCLTVCLHLAELTRLACCTPMRRSLYSSRNASRCNLARSHL